MRPMKAFAALAACSFALPCVKAQMALTPLTPVVPTVAGLPPAASVAAASIDPEKIRAHVRFLSLDLLEGRGPGTGLF